MTEYTASPDVLSNTATGKLKSLFERIERLNEDRAAVMTDLKEVYAEAKGEGFDTKIVRKVIAKRAPRSGHAGRGERSD